MEDIKIVKSLEDSGLLLKGVTKTVPNEVKEQKGGFLSMLLGILGASLLGNILAGKGINRAGKGQGINRAGEGAIAKSISKEMKSKRQVRGIVRAGYGSRSSKMDFYTNFEIQKYCQNEPGFNGVYCRDNLPECNSIEIKDGT